MYLHRLFVRARISSDMRKNHDARIARCTVEGPSGTRTCPVAAFDQLTIVAFF